MVESIRPMPCRPGEGPPSLNVVDLGAPEGPNASANLSHSKKQDSDAGRLKQSGRPL